MDVPAVVADDVPVVAASMTAQRIAGTMLDTTFGNPGKAYEALRRVVPTDLANQVRKVNRAANAAKHPSEKASGKESDSSTDADFADQASMQALAEHSFNIGETGVDEAVQTLSMHCPSLAPAEAEETTFIF